MFAYVFTNVYGLTDNYHDGGGALVITNRDPVEVLCEAAHSVDPKEENKWEAEYVVESDEEKVFIFPNAGCC